MLKIATGASARPDENGNMYFEGSPFDLQEGDMVLDEEYAVLRKSYGQHNGEKAVTITLCDAGAYWYEVPRGGEPEEVGRQTLTKSMRLRFTRPVDHFDFGEEDELFYELTTCQHDEHDAYDQEWRGKCKNLPQGLLVGINMDPGCDSKDLKMSCKIVDSSYANGVVLFADGTAFQSHPDREWIGWLKKTD